MEFDGWRGDTEETRVQRERRVRDWLGGQLRQRDRLVPEVVWKRLKEDGQLDDVLDRGEVASTKRALVKAARTYLASYRAEKRRDHARKRRRSGSRIPAPEEIKAEIDLGKILDPKEIMRAQVLSRAMMHIAEARTWSGPEPWASRGKPVVAQFREVVLGGSVIDRNRAERLIRSPGAALFEFDFFHSNRIPILEHSSELTSGFDWDAPDTRLGLTPRSEVTFRWNGRQLTCPIGDRAGKVEWSQGGLSPVWRGQELMFTVAADSVLGWLTSISSLLSVTCSWNPRQAAMFILTGECPQIFPIDVGLPDHSIGESHAIMRLELTIHPWISRASLLEVYKRIQRIVVGPRNRPPEIASLQFCEFVSEQRHQGKNFRQAMEAWVLAHSKDRKRYPKRDPNSLSRFTNKFRDIERQILYPFGRPDLKEA